MAEAGETGHVGYLGHVVAAFAYQFGGTVTVTTKGDGMMPSFYGNEYDKLDRLFANNPKLYYIAIGETDFLYKANEDLRKYPDGKHHPYVCVGTPGGHIWRNWRIYLVDFSQRLFK